MKQRSATTENHNGMRLSVILLTVMLALLAVLSIFLKCGQMQMAETNRMMSIADKLVRRGSTEVRLMTRTISHLGYTRENEDELRQMFELAAENNPYANEYYIQYSDNTSVFSSGWNNPDQVDLTQREWFLEASDADNPHISSVYIDSITDRPVLTFSAPLYENGEFIGVVAADYFTDDLAQALKDDITSDTYGAILVDRDGNVVIHADPTKVTSTENGLVKYQDIGISSSLIGEPDYTTEIGTNLDVYSALYDEEYGYTIIAVEGAFDYFGIALGFILLSCSLFVLVVLYMSREEQRQQARQKEVLQKAYEAAEIDYLTGIFNRGAGEKRVIEALDNRQKGMFCLMDIDKFKSINDRFGHAVGDKVIVGVAECLKKTFREQDVVMRLGGDEYAVYAPDVTDREEAEQFMQKLFENCRTYSVPELGDQQVALSVGIRFYDGKEDLPFDQMYRNADGVSYETKKQEGSSYRFYEK